MFMNIFDRALQCQRMALRKINFLNRPFTTRDLYFSDIVAIDFIIGQRMFFYIVKNNCKFGYMKNDILDSIEIQDVIKDNDIRVISIDFNNLRDTQFAKEQAEIKKIINGAGVKND